MPQHGKQSSMHSSSGGRNSTVEPFSRLISIPTIFGMSTGVRVMTVFGVFSLHEAYNFRKDRRMSDDAETVRALGDRKSQLFR